jgi:3-mercaptopyruvate sulfurtransferase SseA
MFFLDWLNVDPEKNYKKTNFDMVQCASSNTNEYILINTLPMNEQNCLISGTIHAFTEEKQINDMMSNIHSPDKKIIIYGKNANDESVYKKYRQMQNLGITSIFIYTGGLFEWMLLQDIYGMKAFPTTMKVIDILKYKSSTDI